VPPRQKSNNMPQKDKAFEKELSQQQVDKLADKLIKNMAEKKRLENPVMASIVRSAGTEKQKELLRKKGIDGPIFRAIVRTSTKKK